MKLSAGQFYGQTSQKLAIEGFRLTEKTYRIDSELPSHAHELAHFCFVLNGNYDEKIGFKSYDRTPSALVYYPPEVSHAERHRTDGRHFLIEIDFSVLEKLRECGAELREPFLLQDHSMQNLAIKMYRDFHDRDAFSALSLENMAVELLINSARENIGRNERKPPLWLKKVKEFLYENSAQTPSLNELAALVQIHPTHLARTFRRFEKCTAGDYLRRIRIEKARKQILSSDESLAQIALETGFADQTHFTRSFKKIVGVAPNEFRRTFKKR